MGKFNCNNHDKYNALNIHYDNCKEIKKGSHLTKANKVYRESKIFRESDALWDSDGCLRMRSRNISTRGNPTMQQKWLIFRFAINLMDG